MVHPEVGDGVEEQNSRSSDSLGGKVQGSEGDGQAEVRDEDEDGLVGAEHGAGGLEVADAEPLGQTLGLPLLAALTSAGVEQEIHLPAEELVEDNPDELGDGGVLKQLVQVDAGKDAVLLGLGGGHKGHVEVHVAGEAVVAVVRVLPREVGHQEERVEEPSDDVVELAVSREGTVAALVAQDPDTSAHEALNKAVDHPGGDAQPLVRDGGNVGQGSPDEGGHHGKVAEDIVEGGEERGLEAVGGDGILDGLDIGELRLLLLRLQSHLCDRISS